MITVMQLIILISILSSWVFSLGASALPSASEPTKRILKTSTCEPALKGQSQSAKVKAFLKEQSEVLRKYQIAGRESALRRLSLDAADDSLSQPLRGLAKILKNEITGLTKNDFATYDLSLTMFADYLDLRFFSNSLLNETPKALYGRLKRIGENQISAYAIHAEGYVRVIQFPGIASLAEMAELRAYGMTPIGTIELPTGVDGSTPQGIRYFRNHDEGHIRDWVRELRGQGAPGRTGPKGLFLKTSAFYKELSQFIDSNPSQISPKIKELFYFLYFYPSHEINRDIVSAYYWLKAIYIEFVRGDEPLLELKSRSLTDLFPEKIRMAGDRVPLVSELNLLLKQRYGWKLGKVTYAEFIEALSLIQALIE